VNPSRAQTLKLLSICMAWVLPTAHPATAHELAHWWYTTRCLVLPFGKNTESFARDFDASYESFMRRAGGVR
jgi:hypothetical protein